MSGPSNPDEPGRITGRARVPVTGAGGGSADAGSVPPSRRVNGGDYGVPPAAPRPRAKPRWGRIALVTVALLAVLGLLGAAGAYWYAKSLNDDLSRADPFSAITGGRPAKTVEGSLNILMLGSDSRDPDSPKGDNNGPSRTDTIIVMHIPKSHDKAYLVSIPRDLYVYVPKSPDGQFGDRRAKINAAFAWGGLPLVVQTVEGFTGLRMDHVVMIDFFGFKDVTDALGGVDMYVERDIKSIHSPFRQFKKGMNHFNGEEALDYCRQRYQFPDGDFARMRHQQEFLKALMDKAASSGTLTNPFKLNAFLKAVTRAMTVDNDFSLVDMALQFRSLRSDDLAFLTSPYTGTDMINGESVVLSDKAKAVSMYDAMAQDRMAEWVAAHPKPSARPTG
jgi:LCP family protein required for cell wall assembly